MRAGDAVLHKPSGETWRLGAVRYGRVYPNGWPPGNAPESECEVVQASDEQHAREVREWCERSRGDERGYPDHRHTINQLTAVDIGIAEFVDVPCRHCRVRGTEKEFRLKPVMSGPSAGVAEP